jgi:hypothetical protein
MDNARTKLLAEAAFMHPNPSIEIEMDIDHENE